MSFSYLVSCMIHLMSYQHLSVFVFNGGILFPVAGGHPYEK